MPSNRSDLPDKTLLSNMHIDKQAAAILNSATRAVKAILERRAELDKQGLQDTPLIVIAGENHNMPAHQLHHMLVLDGLTKNGESVALGYEFEHNLLDEAFFEFAQEDHNPVYADQIKQQDQDGKLSLAYLYGLIETCDANFSRNILQRYLSHSDIKICLSDAACRGDYLDAKDPTTNHSMTTCLKKTSHFIHYAKPEGMQVRNHHMSTMLTAFAKNNHSRIAIQQCGYIHVAGHVPYGIPFKDSLTAQFKGQGMPVLAMPLLCNEFQKHHLPSDYKTESNEELFLTGLPELEACYAPDTGKKIEGFPADLQSQEEEVEWVNAILKQTALSTESAGIKEVFDDRSKTLKQIEDTFNDWDQKFYPNLKP